MGPRMKRTYLRLAMAVILATTLTACQTRSGTTGAGSVSTNTDHLSIPGTSTAAFTLTASGV